jgi:hypothetical protein
MGATKRVEGKVSYSSRERSASQSGDSSHSNICDERVSTSKGTLQ